MPPIIDRMPDPDGIVRGGRAKPVQPLPEPSTLGGNQSIRFRHGFPPQEESDKS